jgi:hypothetical protein
VLGDDAGKLVVTAVALLAVFCATAVAWRRQAQKADRLSIISSADVAALVGNARVANLALAARFRCYGL